MKFELIALLVILAVIGLFAWLAVRNAKLSTAAPRPRRHKGFRRQWRKIYLLPIAVHRLIGFWPGVHIRPQLQFANIGEGTFADGVKSYIADAATNSRYLLYKKGTDVDHCAVTGAGDDPLG